MLRVQLEKLQISHNSSAQIGQLLGIFFEKSRHQMFIVHALSTIKYTGATNRVANAPVIWVDIGHFSLH